MGMLSMEMLLQQHSSLKLNNFEISIPIEKRLRYMSRHTSFGKSNKGAKKRNVLKRFERVDVLKKLGRWNEQNKSVTGLPKTPIIA